MALVQIKLNPEEEQILHFYCGLKYIKSKQEAICDMINTIGKEYVNYNLASIKENGNFDT